MPFHFVVAGTGVELDIRYAAGKKCEDIVAGLDLDFSLHVVAPIARVNFTADDAARSEAAIVTHVDGAGTLDRVVTGPGRNHAVAC